MFMASMQSVRRALLMSTTTRWTSTLSSSSSQRMASSAAAEVRVEDVFSDIYRGLEKESGKGELSSIAKYYFDGQGKVMRPILALLTAKTVNHHLRIEDDGELVQRQRCVAMVAEMYHTASLMHDDVIDRADTRRGKVSMNRMWGQKRSIEAGNYSVAIATKEIAGMGDVEVVRTMTDILERLVEGELQQMAAAKEERADVFQLYIDKSFNKTASLMANACKAVTQLAINHVGAETQGVNALPTLAYNFGRNLGLCFQLVDDWLDFVADAAQLGKPGSGSDLKLGLATAPVLFAMERHVELETMMKRRFRSENDVQRALKLVHDSDGLDQTKQLAAKFAAAAANDLNSLTNCDAKNALKALMDNVLNRMR